MPDYTLALDQRTTSSHAMVFDSEGHAVAYVSHEVRQIYPKVGWVEHDPMDIWLS